MLLRIRKLGSYPLNKAYKTFTLLLKLAKLIKITPGVKMFARNDDQKRVTFAHNALQDGASFVVIGRELIESKKPLDLLKEYGEQNKNKNLWTK